MPRKRDNVYNFLRGTLGFPIGHSDSSSTSGTPAPGSSSSRSVSLRERPRQPPPPQVSAGSNDPNTVPQHRLDNEHNTRDSSPHTDVNTDTSSQGAAHEGRNRTQPDLASGSAQPIPAIEVSEAETQYAWWDPSSQEARKVVYPDLGAYNHTRLITIQPEDPGDPRLKCTSEAVELHDDGVSYDALSYAWGSDHLSEEIVFNGYRFPVRQTLYRALIALRRLGVFTAWVDNLSIDQDDTADKDRQISKMHVIYSHADLVYAWIGDRDEPGTRQRTKRRNDGEAGVDFLSKALPNRALVEHEITAVQNVVARPYWTRCWILQELCRSKKALVLCGESQADFAEFWSNLEAFQKRTGDAWVEEDLRVHFDSLKAFHKQETAKTRNPQMSLIQALLLSRYSHASIPRDKIFAMLNLAHDSDKLVDTPNYRQPTNTVLWKLAHNMIHLQGHVAIILLARRELPSKGSQLATATDGGRARGLGPASATGRTRQTAHQRLSSLTSQDVRSFIEGNDVLPSWVPYWPKLDDPLPWWVSQSVEDTRARTLSRHGEPDVANEGSILRIRGVRLESVESISGMMDTAKYSAPQPNEPPATASRTDPETALEMTLSRQSSWKAKQFSNAAEVVRKLWNTLLAPICAEDGKDIPPVTHDYCNKTGCCDNEEGYACASVLMYSDSSHRKVIQKWMRANRRLSIGERSLQDWLNELLETGNSPSDHRARSSRDKRRSQQGLCDFATEADLLDRAFQTLERYNTRLAVTSRCTFKLVYREAQPGDVVCRLDGCSLPVLLRSISEKKPAEGLPTFHDFELPSLEPQPDFSSVVPPAHLLGRSNSSARLTLDSIAMQPHPATSPQGLEDAEHHVSTAQVPRSASIAREDSYTSLAASGAHEGFEHWQYIGEVYRYQHLHAPWADPSRTGWKDSHFAPMNWIDFKIV